VFEPATEDRYNFRFSAGQTFTDKFERLAEVLGIVNPHNQIEAILDQAIEIALEKKDPKRKLERRRKREARKQKPARPSEEEKRETKSEVQDQAGARTEPQRATQAETGPPEVSRYTSSEVRERRFEKAGYQCEFRGPDGSRCTCRTGLEIDHILPFAVFEINDEENLRALCPAHNRFAAEQFYGREFIQRKIEAAKRERESMAPSAGRDRMRKQSTPVHRAKIPSRTSSG
jgi:hypothetical protein